MIYICIPTHNEERTIGVLLWKIRQVLADFPRDYQILVANDGSTDATAEILAPYQRVLPLTVFQTHRPRGYATSLEQLLRAAVSRAEYPKRDVIVTLQADFTDDPDTLSAMLKKIEAGADLVCTSSSLPPTASRAHRWTQRLADYVIGAKRWPEGVSDPLGGFRAYRVMIVKRALDQRAGQRLLSYDGVVANAELLREVAAHSRRNDSVPTRVRHDRLQRASRLHFWSVAKALLRFARGQRGPLAGAELEVAEAAETPRARGGRGGRQPGAPELRYADRPERVAAERTGNGRRSRAKVRSRNDRDGGRPRTERLRPALEAKVAPQEGEPKKRRRRRKRGGTRSEGTTGAALQNGTPLETAPAAPSDAEGVAEGNEAAAAGEVVRKRRRSRRGRGGRGRRKDGNRNGEAGPEIVDAAPAQPAEPPAVTETERSRIDEE